MRRSVISVFILALAACACALAAQPPRTAAVYHLGPGDELEVLVQNEADARPWILIVAPDGALSLPLEGLDPIPAEGMTFEQLKTAIIAQLKKLYKRPRVVITPRRFVQGRIKVLVMGNVQKPGAKVYQSGMRLMDAIGMAEGLIEKSSPGTATIIRTAQAEVEQVDLRALFERGDQRQNKPLQPDDIVVITGRQNQVSVFGQVEKAGVFPWQEGMKLFEALALAQGIRAGADLRQAFLVRGGERQPLNLYSLLEQSEVAENIALEPDDTVIIPQAKREVLVLGGVENPGSYPFLEGQRVMNAIGLAGSFSPLADQNGVVRITRGSERLAFDLRKANVEGETSGNVPLQPGDIVLVPLLREVTVVGEVREAGTFRMEQGMRVADALGRARGVTERANPRSAKIFRTGQIVEVNLEKINEGDESENKLLEPGDTILVTAHKSVSIFGAVGVPGVHPMPENPSVLSLIASANGLLPEQAAEEATIMRMQKGKPTLLTINTGKLLEGDPSQNAKLEAGDVVVIPFRKTQTVAQRVQSSLGLVQSLLTTQILLRR